MVQAQIQMQLDAGLANAVSTSRLGEVKRLLRSGANPNSISAVRMVALSRSTGIGPDINDEAAFSAVTGAVEDPSDDRDAEASCLWMAAYIGNTQVMKELIDAGADVGWANAEGSTALYVACDKGHVPAVRLLLGAGAAVDAARHGGPREQIGWTPLMNAVSHDQADVARLLLAAGARTDVKYADGSSLLHLVSGNNVVELVRLLLGAGAKVDAENKLGCTPLEYAFSTRSCASMKLLLKAGADISRTCFTKGNKMLAVAASCGEARLAELLVEAGADVNEKALTGNTYLLEACHGHHTEVVRLLLEHGAHVNVAAANGRTALNFVAEWGYADLAKLLLRHGADVHAVRPDGWNALGTAIMHSHAGVVKLLLEAGADVNKAHERDDVATPLHVASVAGNAAVVRVLLAHGADVDARSHKGQTALQLAAELQKHEVARLLLDHMDGKSPSHADAAKTVSRGSGQPPGADRDAGGGSGGSGGSSSASSGAGKGPASGHSGADDSATTRCAACGAMSAPGGGKLRACACLGVRYCSKDCQRKHWPIHKPACSARK